MNVDDNTNAMNQLDSMHDYQDRRIAAEERYCNEFLQLAAKGDAGAVAEFAPIANAFARTKISLLRRSPCFTLSATHRKKNTARGLIS